MLTLLSVVALHMKAVAAPGQAASHDVNATAVPAWYQQRYDNLGAYDWLTGESAPFEWGKKLYLMESIMCGCKVTSFASGCVEYEYYWGHDHEQFPSQSYLRIRELEGGALVANLPHSGGYGFGSVLADAHTRSRGKVWVFGTPHNRCNATSLGCDGKRPCWVAAWSSDDPSLRDWRFAGPVLQTQRMTWNTAVARVEGRPLGPARLPQYVMILESLGPTAGGLLNMTFAANDNTDGDLSSGWRVLPHDIRDEAMLGNRTEHTLGVCPFIRQ